MPIYTYACESGHKEDILIRSGTTKGPQKWFLCNCGLKSKLQITVPHIVDGRVKAGYENDIPLRASDGDIDCMAYYKKKGIHPKKDPALRSAMKECMPQQRQNLNRAVNRWMDKVK